MSQEQPPNSPWDDGPSERLGQPRPAPPYQPPQAANLSREVPIEEEREVHLGDYLRVLHKRRWLAITAFTLIVGATVVQAFTATPIFQARVRLLIESDDPNVVSFQNVIDEQQAKADYYTTQYNILQSRSLARKTIDSLNMWDKAPLGGASTDAAKPTGLWATAKGFVTGLFSTSEAQAAESDVATPVEPPAADETASQSSAIDRLIGNLGVAPIRNSRLVDVSYQSTDPALATQIANALARNYIDQNLDYRFSATQDASDWLGQRVAEQRTQVEAAEAALQRYRERHGAIPLEDGENIVVQKLTQLNTEVTRAKTDRIQQEAMYMELREHGDDRARLETFPAILTNTFIQQQKTVLADLLRQQTQLAETYGDRNERMIRIRSEIEGAQAKLDAEIQKVVQAVETEYRAAVAREESLVRALNEQKSEALRMNGTAIQYNVLNREVESTRQIYDTLMQRSRETGVSGALRTSNIRIVDEAERPRSPVSPNRRMNVMVGLFAGMVAALGLVFGFEYMDNRIKSPDEIKHYLRLPHLGLVPRLPASKDPDAVYPLLSEAPPPAFLEAFRVIRTNVLFSAREETGQVLLVTSTGPNEGKSLTAANLAISLAQTGKRILVLDADMRKPKAHLAFSMAQEPGLSNLLVGDTKASVAVKATGVPGVWLLPAGQIPPNPAELLGSDRLRHYLDQLRAHFDWVVMDSPPVMAVADASVLAHRSQAGVVFVVGADMTNRNAALKAVEQLEKSGAYFVGAVLNKADLQRNAYYYSQYYKREYASYYQG